MRVFDREKALLDAQGVPQRRVVIVLVGTCDDSAAAAQFVKHCTDVYGRATFVTQANAQALDRVLATSSAAVIVSGVSRAALLGAWRDESRASVFVITSTLHSVPAVVRRAANYVVIAGHMAEERERQHVHRSTCSLRVPRHEFVRVYDETVRAGQLLVIHCDDLPDETDPVGRTFSTCARAQNQQQAAAGIASPSWMAWLRSFWW